MLTAILILFLVAADQFSKWLAVKYLEPIVVRPLVPGIIQLRFIRNNGAAFSIFAGKQIFLILFTSAALAALIVLLVLKKFDRHPLERWGVVFILAGGIGNLVDRIVSGTVVDFFEFLFMQWGIFNVADIFVTVGVCLFLLSLVLEEVHEHRQKRAARTAGQPPEASAEKSDD